MTKFDQIALRIIKEQEMIVGPLAWEEAKKVPGIQIIDIRKGEVILQNGDLREVLNKLVSQYENLFGRASHEVCREAVRDLIKEMPKEEVPSRLK